MINKKSNRFVALDVMRGATIAAMILVNNPGSWQHIYAQLEHAPWHGWTFTDTIFPFFLFIVGVSIVFALKNKKDQLALRLQLHKKIIKRFFILLALGFLLSGFPYYDLASIRIPGVLERIAVCYLIVALLYIHFSTRVLIVVTVLLLSGYWALMAWYPVPGIGAGSLERGRNFAAYVDQIFLSGHMWSATKTWDPEGIISTLPAIATTLFGVFSGLILTSEVKLQKRLSKLFLSGLMMIFLGMLWSQWLPINKNLWTSSYAVFMSGMAMVVLAVLSWWIDIKQLNRLSKPFIIYGMNAITVFVLSGIIGRLLYLLKWESDAGTTITLKTWLYHHFFTPWLSDINASLAYAILWIVLSYLAMYALYKKQIFLKV